MAVRRLSNKKTVHVFYDEIYETSFEHRDHLPDLRNPMKELGYDVIEYFVTPETVVEKSRKIPRSSPDHIIFLHIDMPLKAQKGTELHAARYLEENFKYVCGLNSTFSENCTWKSTMNELFEKYGVPHAETIRIESMRQFESERVLRKLKEIRRPFFIKVDDGYNSLGLSNACVMNSVDELREKTAQMLVDYGPVTIQRFLGGREFTVAVTEGRAYVPVERIFEEGQLVSGANGTKTERVMDPSEDFVEEIQRVAVAAFEAVGGTAYARVDIRQDPETRAVFALEVNSGCSIRPQSYFELSVEAASSSIRRVVRNILRNAVPHPPAISNN